MSKLNQGELLQWFDEAWGKCTWDFAIKEHDKQAYQQIKELIQKCYRWEDLKNNSHFQKIYYQYMKEVLNGDADWRSTIEERLDKLERPGK